jgi:hypothetical protein
MGSGVLRTAGTLACFLLLAVANIVRSDAATFRWAFQGDVLSLDPQDRRDTFSRDFVSNIM